MMGNGIDFVKHGFHGLALAGMVFTALLCAALLAGCVSTSNGEPSAAQPAASPLAEEQGANDATEPVDSTDDPSSEELDEPEPVDKESLNALIEECSQLDSASYTKDTFKEFKAALKEARKVAKAEDKTQNQVDSAIVNLNAAREKLVEKFNPDSYKSVKYEKIARNPDDYVGKKIKFSGTVLQVIEGEEENMIRLGTKDTYDDVVIVGYDPALKKERILEDDVVTVYGDCVGLYSYEATLGQTITLPALFAAEITIDN
ncbi:hypothetical protein [uncultured Adlercreutzia sp.]|uniref:hypothetical protein n=1 Tax=uncultured Adlercreutzia sp. TaxID=875803 RepID=UPI0025DF869A|nr:hypothetical protein [uncultured Adlercreutzia sp.]MCI9261284.1 hypothetical protein [Eggerthellaceae bacterium]